MAYLSRPSSKQMFVRNYRDHGGTSGRRSPSPDGGDDSSLDSENEQRLIEGPSEAQIAKCEASREGVTPAGRCDRKTRALCPIPAIDDHMPDRMYFADREGDLTVCTTDGDDVRNVPGRERAKVLCIDRAYLPETKSCDGQGYHLVHCGMNDGVLRTYRLLTEKVLKLDCTRNGGGIRLDPEYGGLIRKVDPGSPADEAGMRPGMYVTAINGVAVMSSPVAATLLRGAGTAGQVTIDCTSCTEANGADPQIELYSELKRHAGAINAIRVIDGPERTPLVFTASADWRAYMWKWNCKRRQLQVPCGLRTEAEFLSAGREQWHLAGVGEQKLEMKCRFEGASKALQCLCVTSEEGRIVVYAGGDDKLIHAWDATDGGHRCPGFPAKGHTAAVTGLTKAAGRLYSTSRDGSIRVWEAKGGAAVRALQPPGTVPQLCVTAVGNRVWTGGADGAVQIWNPEADDTEPDRCCELLDNTGHMITSLTPVPKGPCGSVVWVSDPVTGTVKVHYSGSFEYTAKGWAPAPVPASLPDLSRGFTEAELALCKEIHFLRGVIIPMADEVRLWRARKEYHLAMRTPLKLMAARYFLSTLLHRDRQWCFTMLRRYSHRQQVRRVAAEAARRMLKAVGRDLAVYFWKQWLKWSHDRRARRWHRQAAAALVSCTNSGLASVYWGHLCRYARAVERRRLKRRSAEAVLKHAEHGMRLVCFHKWQSWTEEGIHARALDAAWDILAQHHSQGLIRKYYDLLLRWRIRQQVRRPHLEAATALLQQSSIGTLGLCWAKWALWIVKAGQRRLKQGFFDSVKRINDRGLRRVYHQKCLNWHCRQQALSVKQKVRQAAEDIRQSEANIMRNAKTLSSLEREKESLEAQICRLEQELVDAEKENAEATSIRDAAAQEMRLEYEPDPTQDVTAQADTVLLAAKAYACNCRTDYDFLRWAREQIHPRRTEVDGELTEEQSLYPIDLCTRGVRQIEATLRGEGYAVTEGTIWQVLLHEFDALLAGRAFFAKCQEGLLNIVLGWDALRPDPALRRSWLLEGNGGAVLRNAPHFWYIIRKAKEFREAADEVAWEQAEELYQAEVERRAGIDERRLSVVSLKEFPPPSPVRRMSSASAAGSARVDCWRRTASPSPSSYSFLGASPRTTGCTVRVSAWCVEGPSLPSNPIIYEPPACAIADPIQRAVLNSLCETASSAMERETDLGRMKLGELLSVGFDPIRRLSGSSEPLASLEAAPLRPSPEAVAGLRKWFTARGVSMGLDAEVEAYLADYQHRWQLWRHLTVREFTQSDGSGWSTPADLQRLPSLYDCAPELTIGAAEMHFAAAAGKEGVAQRAARNSWRGDSVPDSVPGGGVAPGRYDFFKLMVWDLVQSCITDKAAKHPAAPPTGEWMAGLQGLPRGLRGMSAFGHREGKVAKHIAAIQQRTGANAAAVLALTGAPKEWLMHGHPIRNAWRGGGVAHLKYHRMAPEGNTAIFFGEGFEQEGVANPLKTPDGDLSHSCLHVLLRDKRGGASVCVVAVHFAPRDTEVEHYAQQLDELLSDGGEHTILCGTFGLNLRDPVAWRRLVGEVGQGGRGPQRKNLAQFLLGARSRGHWGGESEATTCSRLSFFQSEVGRIGHDEAHPGTYVLAGAGLRRSHVAGFLVRHSGRRLPDADVPSAHAPVTLVADLCPPPDCSGASPERDRDPAAMRRSSSASYTFPPPSQSLPLARQQSLRSSKDMARMPDQLPSPTVQQGGTPIRRRLSCTSCRSRSGGSDKAQDSPAHKQGASPTARRLSVTAAMPPLAKRPVAAASPSRPSAERPPAPERVIDHHNHAHSTPLQRAQSCTFGSAQRSPTPPGSASMRLSATSVPPPLAGGSRSHPPPAPHGTLGRRASGSGCRPSAPPGGAPQRRGSAVSRSSSGQRTSRLI
eukprot:TRINITY_DN70062_c0_g1_i1.p1 TRINITY_DN70062_c0_g1~~TRINITY_DN70062_c0_g1_i1.p1  ORF type:complete len:1941 (+),score=489.78 TRINITY_DN70062_c0_g1_i1:131-5824(+)